MQVNSSTDFADNQEPSALFETLPELSGLPAECPRRTRIQLDLLLLSIESVERLGAEAMLYAAKDLQLQHLIKNRVVLWRLRSTSPYRRQTQRRPLSLDEAKALTLVTCYLARRLTVLIRQLLLAQQQLNEQGLGVEQHFRLNDYLERFRSYFRKRMQPRRLMDDAKLNEMAIELLNKLLLCSGTAGPARLWASLFDGEVE
ncbi:DUF3038 domain-containing protein [Leptolyngbya sp. FACHB-261]|uniref:DUF3038 domain-containing protein n=1 Tax=Leptolyngbya sp. FACHB-261 TaxID=2692806 RepID=UPI0016892B72|nr:DUF3038 domain-containing protein [Leptolyngbya sp. FACHB-261]MBD2099679.1 DUF3038 domain-containing protein [Leptolyngbya sp. FACHB-261]